MDLSGGVLVLRDLRSSAGSLRLQDGVGESHARGCIMLAGTSQYLHWPEEGTEEVSCCFY